MKRLKLNLRLYLINGTYRLFDFRGGKDHKSFEVLRCFKSYEEMKIYMDLMGYEINQIHPKTYEVWERE